LSAQIRVGEESSGELTKTGDQLPSMAVGNLGFAAAAAVDGRERRAQAVGSAPCPASTELFFFFDGIQG